MTGRYTWRQDRHATYHVAFDGVPFAEIVWGGRRPVEFERLAMDRIVRWIGVDDPQPARTWAWKPGTPSHLIAAVLTHNGDEMASIAWLPLPHRKVLRRPTVWLDRITDAMNRPATAADPIPEPAPPAWARKAAV